MKYRALLLCLAGLLISACSEDKPAPQAARPTTETQPAPESAAPMDEPVAADEEELVYDPIDVSKLENEWWQQYSGEGG